MATARPPILLKHNFQNSFPGTQQASWTGAQNVANQKGWNIELPPIDNGQVNSIAISKNTIYAVGTFTSVGGSARAGACAWNKFTGVLLPWAPVFAGGALNSVDVDDATAVYVGGAFTSLNGDATKKWLVKIDPITGLNDATFAPALDNFVNIVKIQSSSLNTLAIGGAFTTAGGAGNLRFAILDKLSGVSIAPVHTFDGNPLAIAFDNVRGLIYVGGNFGNADATVRNGVCRLSTSTWLINAWNPNASSVVRAIVPTADGLIYLGGSFLTLNAVVRNFVGCVDQFGTATAWNPILNNTVRALVQYQDVIIIAGDFAGTSPSLTAVATDATVIGFNAFPGISSALTLAIDQRTAYVGGAFVIIKGVAQRGISAVPFPFFTDTNSIYVSKAGLDTNAGTFASPKLTLKNAYVSIGAKQYVVVKDSGIYNEDLDITTTAQFYSVDGQAPTLTRYPGAVTGTHGARRVGRVANPVNANIRYVAKFGNNATGTLNDPTRPFLTLASAITASADGNAIEFLDDGEYLENVVVNKTLTIQASIGKLPVINNIGTTAHTIEITTLKILQLYGMTIIGPSFYNGIAFDCIRNTSGGISNLVDCSISGGSIGVNLQNNNVAINVLNNTISKAWGQYSFLCLSVTGASTVQNNVFSSDSILVGGGAVCNALQFASAFNLNVLNNSVLQTSSGGTIPNFGLGISVSGANNSVAVVESNYMTGCGSGMRLFSSPNAGFVGSVTVRNNLAENCNLSGFVFTMIDTNNATRPHTFRNNIGRNNCLTVPASLLNVSADMYFDISGNCSVIVSENVSINSFANAFIFFANTASFAGSLTITANKNICMRPALNGFNIFGRSTTETMVATSIPNPGNHQINFVAPSGASFVSPSVVILTGTAGTFTQVTTPPAGYQYNVNATGLYTFAQIDVGTTVSISANTSLTFGTLNVASTFLGNVFYGCGANALTSSQMTNAFGLTEGRFNYFNFNASISPITTSITGVITATTLWRTVLVAPTFGADGLKTINFISTAIGSERLGLFPDSNGTFSAYLQSIAPQDDIGMNNYIVRVTSNRVQFDGFIIQGTLNLWGGIKVMAGFQNFQASYCTFTNCACYGVRHLGVTNTARPLNVGCDYSANDNGCMDFNPANVSQFSTFRGNGGAGIYLYLGEAILNHLSLYRNGYGIFESAFATTIQCSNCIGAQNAIADASGDSIYSRCNMEVIVGGITLIDSSTQLNPLFRDPDAGDLRLQAIAVGSFFNSPNLGTSNDGQGDIGAFLYNYGALVQTFTLLDFGAVGFRNPDKLVRTDEPIKLFEGTREDGGTYTGAVAYRTSYRMEWLSASNDMPDAQVVAIQTMFDGAIGGSNDGTVSMSLDGGTIFIPCKLLHQAGIEFQEMTGRYSSTEVPTPIKEITVRVSS